MAGTDAQAGRACTGCGRPLSRYNAEPVCGSCTRASRDNEAAADVVVNGERLKELRTARGLTLQVVADRAGISKSLLSKLETGYQTSTSAGNLSRIAGALGTTLDGLLRNGALGGATSAAQARQQDHPADGEPHLGDRLASLRRAAGLTQDALAERSGISADVIRKLEQRRKHGARLTTLRALADGLSVNVAALVSGTPDPEDDEDTGSPDAGESSYVIVQLPGINGEAVPVAITRRALTTGAVVSAQEARPEPDPLTQVSPGSSFPSEMVEAVKRREFLLGMASAVSYSAASGLMPTFKHVDPELIPYFKQQLEGHYRADMLLGPRALISTVTAQCHLIGQLIDSADEPTRQRMATVGMSFAAFAAWLHLDAGDVPAAFYWHDTAQEMAHRSRNREAVACALVDRAMARTDQGMGTAVIDLCSSALSDAAHISPEVQVFALQQQAHGASLTGDRRQVDALLDQAGRLIGQVDVEAWGTACLRTPHYVEVQRATCYGRLGIAKEALGVWQQVIPAAPPAARRDVGVWTARQATLAASLREPERTVELARHAVKAALETGSARVRRELATTKATMTPWQAESVGQDFAEVLAPISEGT